MNTKTEKLFDCMKDAFLSVLFLLISYHSSQGQVRDSICLHQFGDINIQCKGIRKLDSAGFNIYHVNNKLFSKKLIHDSLFVDADIWACTSNSVFVGDFISADSIHYFDYVNCRAIEPIFYFKGFCGTVIQRNDLPKLSTIVVGRARDGITFQSCEIYIQRDTGYIHFELHDLELPDKVRNCIMAMHNGQGIIFDNIKIAINGINRKIMNPPGYIIEK